MLVLVDGARANCNFRMDGGGIYGSQLPSHLVKDIFIGGKMSER